jgi:hypothetical protein
MKKLDQTIKKHHLHISNVIQTKGTTPDFNGYKVIKRGQHFGGKKSQPKKIDWDKKYSPRWSWSENLPITGTIIEN